MARKALKELTAKAFLAAAATAALLSFQNCSPSKNFDATDSVTNRLASDNGESYGGKIFSNFDPSTPCLQVGRSGKPLPNSQIVIDANAGAQLVRSNCVDLTTPVLLDASQVSVASDGKTLAYQGTRFELTLPQSDFAVLAANCPAGLTAKSGAVRTNLVANAQDMMNSSTWHNHVGIAASGDGVLGGQPAFALTRNDPTALDFWRRAHPDLVLLGGVTYAYSFFARAGNIGQAYFATTQGTGTLSVIFDLATGAARVFEQTEFSNVSTESRTIGGTRFFTVFFTAPSNASNADGAASVPNNAIGLAPNGLTQSGTTWQQTSQVNDYIVVSTPQLERVDAYCSP